MKKLLCLLAALLLLCPAGLAENSKECEILLPDGYTGTLPVYRATLRDESNVPLFAELDVSLFNQSGEPEFAPALLRKKPLLSGSYAYPDGAVLTTSPEALYYEEYDGTYYNVLLSAEDGSEIHSETPRSSLKSAIAWSGRRGAAVLAGSGRAAPADHGRIARNHAGRSQGPDGSPAGRCWA